MGTPAGFLLLLRPDPIPTSQMRCPSLIMPPARRRSRPSEAPLGYPALSPPHDEARADTSSLADRPSRSRRVFLARAGMVVVLLILTYGNLHRTTTLGEARAALARDDLKSALRVA